MNCNIKTHFDCDGTGSMCERCGESEAVCQCEEPQMVPCEGCDGAMKICVEHDSPCGDGKTCDAAKKKQPVKSTKKKATKKKKKLIELPLRTCKVLTYCSECLGYIEPGQRYRDGGEDRRTHEQCAQKAEIEGR